MKTLLTATLFALLSLHAPAQTASPAASATSAASTLAATPTAVKEMSEAEVRKIDKDAKKITLKHGPIKNLDMPGMTMVFQVRDVGLLGTLAVGDKIMFTAEHLQGAYVMTGAEKVAAK